MRDYIDILLDQELEAEEEFIKHCPICDYCRQPITFNEYYYNYDGKIICDDIDCITDFMMQFRKSVLSYIEDNE